MPQLSADLLIASLDLKCIGVFSPEYLVPAVGGRDDDEDAVGVTSPLECMCRNWFTAIGMKTEVGTLQYMERKALMWSSCSRARQF